MQCLDCGSDEPTTNLGGICTACLTGSNTIWMIWPNAHITKLDAEIEAYFNQLAIAELKNPYLKG